MNVQLTTDQYLDNLSLFLAKELDVNLLLVSDEKVHYSSPLIEQLKDNLIFDYYEVFTTKAALVQKREHTV